MPGLVTAERRRASFVLVTIFIDAIGFGLIMPVLPRLLMNVGRMPLSQTIDLAAWIGLAMAVRRSSRPPSWAMSATASDAARCC